MGFLRWKKDKELVIPGYVPYVDNEIFLQDTLDYPRDVLVITTYSLPNEGNITDYLKKKSADINKLFSGKYCSSESVLQNSDLGLLLQSDLEITERLKKMDDEIKNELKFPKDVQPGNSDDIDMYELPKYFLSLKNA